MFINFFKAAFGVFFAYLLVYTISVVLIVGTVLLIMRCLFG